jgi:hypothetical protein
MREAFKDLSNSKINFNNSVLSSIRKNSIFDSDKKVKYNLSGREDNCLTISDDRVIFDNLNYSGDRSENKDNTKPIRGRQASREDTSNHQEKDFSSSAYTDLTKDPNS